MTRDDTKVQLIQNKAAMFSRGGKFVNPALFGIGHLAACGLVLRDAL